MGKLRVHNIEAQTGTNVDLGAAGDVVTLASDSLQTNLYKDSGGNTLFQSDGLGTLSNINSGLAGAGWKHIQTQTVIRGTTVTSVDFTSGIDNTYNHYIFVFVDLETTYNGTQLTFTPSTDNGATWGINKTSVGWYVRMTHSGSITQPTMHPASGSQQNSSAVQELNYQWGGNAPSNETAVGFLHIYNPSSTTYLKNYYARVLTFYVTNGENERYIGGYMDTTSAVNGFRFDTVQGDLYGGKFKLYGYG